ncbi:ENTH domain-containing protein [Fusarium pseudoanthophilum]|uniref:ENTH domain-containing protein n=2 Tax=Fusarium fujikuroi species complex TaxID=171627 RepID=A0A8H5KX43_9HYPO|nr:ENTH domain-containing protein [Fusarium pseudoanthophilum]
MCRYLSIIRISQNLHLLVLQPPKPNLKSTPTRTAHTPPLVLVLPRPRIVHVPRRGCGHSLVVSLGQSLFLRPRRLQDLLFALVTLKRPDTARLGSSSAAAALIVIPALTPPDPRPSIICHRTPSLVATYRASVGIMSSSFEKSVKGATKIKNAPPKTKYIEHILVATHSGEAGVGEVFRALTYRLRDSTWTVVFKSLITVHLMIREGSPDVTLAFLSTHRNVLAISSFTDAQIQGRNIRHYAHYLAERARAYEKTKTDWVRASESRLEKLSVEKGLLRETEIVQHQLEALLKCDVMENEPENEITITVFRLLVLDLLALFQVLNQGLISILGNFFEMSKVDAERAMAIYRKFTKQTDYVVQYLSVARQHEHHTRVEVPKLKHAPVNLGRQLEEYLHDPDFEVHRRQYLAEQDVKKIGGGSSSKQGGLSKKKSSDFPEPASNNPFPKITASSSGNRAPESKPQANKGPDPDLIDFFDSIEQNQTPMSMNPQPQQQAFQQQPTGMPFQQNGFAPQPTGFASNSPFQQPQQTGFMQPQPQIQQPQIQQPQIQLQPDFTGAGFGGFTPQQQAFQPSSLAPIPQDTMASFPNAAPQIQQPVQNGSPQGLQPMQTGSTNPFRQSMLMAQQTGLPSSATTPALNRQSTNPFARTSPQQNTSPFAQASNSPFQSPSPQQQQPALQPTPTGTNPFARNSTMPAPNQEQRPQTAGAALAPQPTGTTNPFRNGAFVNHNTGMGWQANQQPIGGGLDQLPTVPVFPRPAQQTPWQQ